MAATPRASAAPGSPGGSGRPSTEIVPPVGTTSPVTHLMSADLPAPFCPTTQWT